MTRMLSDVEDAHSQVSVKSLDMTQNTLVLKLADDEIQDIARLVGREGMSREESVWVLANLGLMLRRTLRGWTGSCWGRLPGTVAVVPVLLETQPSAHDVEGIARQITGCNISMSALHYCLAQRLYLLHIVGSSRRGPKPFT